LKSLRVSVFLLHIFVVETKFSEMGHSDTFRHDTKADVFERCVQYRWSHGWVLPSCRL